VTVHILYFIGFAIIAFFPISRQTHRENLERLAAGMRESGVVDKALGPTV
jgi:hypothetical protein